MSIVIPNSKCDQYRRGDQVVVAARQGDDSHCPVVAARRYLDLLRSAGATVEAFVLQSVVVNSAGCAGIGRVASRAVLLAQLRRSLGAPRCCIRYIHSDRVEQLPLPRLSRYRATN